LPGRPYGERTVPKDTIRAIIPEEDSEGAAAPTAPFSAGTAFATFTTAATTPTRAIGIAIVNRYAEYIIRYAS
jgi:hypothetical protein